VYLSTRIEDRQPVTRCRNLVRYSSHDYKPKPSCICLSKIGTLYKALHLPSNELACCRQRCSPRTSSCLCRLWLVYWNLQDTSAIDRKALSHSLDDVSKIALQALKILPGMARRDTATGRYSLFCVTFELNDTCPTVEISSASQMEADSDILGIVSSGPPSIGDKKSIGTPVGQKRLLLF